MSALPSNTSLIIIDTRLVSKIFTLPSVVSNSGRVLIFKDYYGSASPSTFTLVTQGSDLIDDFSNNYVFVNNMGTLTIISDGITSWRIMSSYNGNFSMGTRLPLAPSNVIVTTVGQTVNVTWTGGNANTYIVIFYSNTTNSTVGGTLFETNSSVAATTRTTTTQTSYNSYYYASVTGVNGSGQGPLTISQNATYMNSGPITFTFNGGAQLFTVPAGKTTLGIVLVGAGGNYSGGNGAYVTGNLNVSPGQIIGVIAGGLGYNSGGSYAGGQVLGGGDTGGGEGGCTGGGGSAITDQAGTTYYAIAGGGGGAAGYGAFGGDSGLNGSNGGSVNGSNGGGFGASTGGAGGGSAGGGGAGSYLKGGTGVGSTYSGGGGGGGLFGGGGGAGGGAGALLGGGGGGSSLINGPNFSYTGVGTQANTRLLNGYVTIIV